MAKVSLFADCFELSSSMKLLTSRPDQLKIFPEERFAEGSSNRLPEDLQTINNKTEFHAFVYNRYIEEMKRRKGYYMKR